MLWYLLRTWPGREEMLVKEIQKTVPSYLYQEVFVIYNERIWRRQGESIIHAEPLFPGCVFLTCEKTDPFFMYMQRVPAMSALLASGELSAYPLMDADTEFLEQITDESHVIRLSYVLREEDHTYLVDGPLVDLIPDITGIEFRKRFVKIQKRLWGEERSGTWHPAKGRLGPGIPAIEEMYPDEDRNLKRGKKIIQNGAETDPASRIYGRTE